MTETAPDRGPLSGFRIVDLTENMAGPLATMVLGDQGADVIKVESHRGDQVRRTGSGRHGMAAYFANLNRSKRSISLDLRRPEGTAILDRLIDDSDVVIQAYRPSAARKLGIDRATIKTPARGALVYCEIVGFGSTGPLAGRAVYDHVIQALSGFAALQTPPGTGEPALVRHGVVDKATGLTAAQAITAALLRRSRTGIGESIEVTMLNVALNFMWPDGMMNHTAFEVEYERAPAANSYRLTPTADGHIALNVLTDQQWSGFEAALDLQPADQRTHGERLREAREKLRKMSTTDAIAALTAHDIPCAPMLSLEEIPFHPQIEANGILHTSEHPVLGTVRQPLPEPHLDGMGNDGLRPAPRLGEHSEEILAERGFDPDQIARLIETGVVGSART
jgi:crotonobetainyl-CoA:carnitine CoA-transferase CaiB-like acyl-CoA transferase